MSVLDKIGGLLGGGLGGKIADAFSQVKQGKLDIEKAQIVVEDAISARSHEIEMAELRQQTELEQAFNERTRDMEGTAADLKTIPYIGAFVIFLRGAFRPLFAYFTGYLDFLYFTQTMNWTEKQQALVYAINILVLIFFFGERAMKNVMPLVAKVFESKTA
jgi:hypothetical protein